MYCIIQVQKLRFHVHSHDSATVAAAELINLLDKEKDQSQNSKKQEALLSRSCDYFHSV